MNTALQQAPQAELAATSTRFVDNGDGTVTDTRTGLMWSRDELTETYVNHHQAETLCADLRLVGHADWRLPTDHELLSLVDRSRHSPAIDIDAFPDTQADRYWTSTLVASSPAFAWIVGFSYGLASGCHRDYNSAFVRAVRCVSSGQ